METLIHRLTSYVSQEMARSQHIPHSLLPYSCTGDNLSTLRNLEDSFEKLEAPDLASGQTEGPMGSW